MFTFSVNTGHFQTTGGKDVDDVQAYGHVFRMSETADGTRLCHHWPIQGASDE